MIKSTWLRALRCGAKSKRRSACFRRVDRLPCLAGIGGRPAPALCEPAQVPFILPGIAAPVGGGACDDEGHAGAAELLRIEAFWTFP